MNTRVFCLLVWCIVCWQNSLIKDGIRGPAKVRYSNKNPLPGKASYRALRSRHRTRAVVKMARGTVPHLCNSEANLHTQDRAHVILFSRDLDLACALLVGYYRLWFHIERDFRLKHCTHRARLPFRLWRGVHKFNLYLLLEGGVSWHRQANTISLFCVALVFC